MMLKILSMDFNLKIDFSFIFLLTKIDMMNMHNNADLIEIKRNHAILAAAWRLKYMFII